MPIIDNTSDAYNESSSTSWNATLQNTKIILYAYDKAILALTELNHASYELNTGQSITRVTRKNLPELLEMRSLLLSQISDLECMLGIKKNVKQVIPGW